MNLKNIKDLCALLSEHDLTLIEVEEEGVRIKIGKDCPAPKTGAVPAAPASVPQAASLNPAADEVDFNRLIEVKSPLVGVFYSAASPESVPFVSIGSKVKKGDVLCILETMKLMNEVTADCDGEIVDICIKNGDIAEYGQVLFKMF